MTALVTLREAWNAGNSNAAGASTLAAAGYRAGRWLVKADGARLDTFTRCLEDCRSARGFQVDLSGSLDEFTRLYGLAAIRSLSGSDQS